MQLIVTLCAARVRRHRAAGRRSRMLWLARRTRGLPEFLIGAGSHVDLRRRLPRERRLGIRRRDGEGERAGLGGVGARHPAGRRAAVCLHAAGVSPGGRLGEVADRRRRRVPAGGARRVRPSRSRRLPPKSPRSRRRARWLLLCFAAAMRAASCGPPSRVCTTTAWRGAGRPSGWRIRGREPVLAVGVLRPRRNRHHGGECARGAARPQHLDVARRAASVRRARLRSEHRVSISCSCRPPGTWAGCARRRARSARSGALARAKAPAHGRRAHGSASTSPSRSGPTGSLPARKSSR